MRTVVRAWLRVMVAVGRAMLSGCAGEARAGHGGLCSTLSAGVRPRRSLHATEPRSPRPAPARAPPQRRPHSHHHGPSPTILGLPSAASLHLITSLHHAALADPRTLHLLPYATLSITYNINNESENINQLQLTAHNLILSLNFRFEDTKLTFY